MVYPVIETVVTDMKKSITKMKGIPQAGLIALLSLMTVLFVDGFFPFGGGSVAALDLNSQYIPFLYRFYDVITGVKNMSVDFHIGGGINLYSDTLTEVLNPFNYVLLLFGRSRIYKAVNLLVALYVCGASMTACYSFSKLLPKNDTMLNVALSVAYGMSYFMAYQYEIIRWMYIVVLFPLLMVALYRLLENKKPVIFVVLLAYILALSLQLGLQICFFVFVFCTCRLLKNGLKNIDGAECLLLGMSLLAAVMISAPATIPAVLNIKGSARSVQTPSIISVISHHGIDNILERILEISSPAVIGLMLAAVIGLGKRTFGVLKEYRELTACYIILVITVILEPSNLLWHLGSYQCFPVRYGYIAVWIGLLLSSVLFGAVEDKKEKSRSLVAVAATAVVLPAVIFVYVKRLMLAQAFATLDISHVCRKETFILYAVLGLISVCMAITVLIVKRDSEKRLPKCMFITASALMGIIWFMAVLWPEASPARIQNESAYYEMTESAVTNSIEVYSGHSVQNPDRPLNSALVTGEYSMSAYVPSGESLEYVSMMNSLGYETPWVSVSAAGGSSLSNRLLGMAAGDEGNVLGALLLDNDTFSDIYTIEDLRQPLEQPSTTDIIIDNRAGKLSCAVAEDGKTLILPMAYIDGWRAEGGEVLSVLGGLLAVKADGKDVVLRYHVPGLLTGLCIMAVGMVLLLIAARISGNVKDCRWAGQLYTGVTALFILAIYVLPTLGLFVFFAAKAGGKDLSPYFEKTVIKQENVHTLLSEDMQEDGLHILIGRNNIMNDKKVKVTASDEENHSFRAAMASDGNRNEESRWSSENNWDNNDHFLQADFKENKLIKAVNIYWERTNATQYSIEVSQDGTNWNTVSEFDEATVTNPQIIYYPEGIEGRFLRLHVKQVMKNEEDGTLYYQNVSVRELEVYDDLCDSFVIQKPELVQGVNRKIPVPEVPKGYKLKPGGIDYDNLMTKDGCFADTIAPVDICLGYELSIEGDRWDLPGFELTLPASEENDNSTFEYNTVEVKEWKGEDGCLEPEDSNELIQSLKDKTACSQLSFEVDDTALYLGEEGYEITTDNGGIHIKAMSESGLCGARVTLTHMLEEQSDRIPFGTLRDYPKYAVRGFVLDVARRPVSIEFIYRILEQMSDKHMNTLQLHLNDNTIISVSDYDKTVEGARKLYSAFRLESSLDAELTSEDFCYTDEQIRKLIDDAAEMGIEVIPEIDTPAHCMFITKQYPQLGYDDAPELADTLDVSKPEALELALSIWSEYLENDSEALFEGCKTLHLGTDEFFGDNAAYSVYLKNLTSGVASMAPDKKLRVWASLDYNKVDRNVIDRDVEMMVWSPIWSDPLRTYEDGFKIINCLNQNLYIIVDGGTDRLDMNNLENNWEPNIFRDESCDETIPSWSPRMLGACYCMWNDNYALTGEGPDDDGLFERFEEPLELIADKLWN